MSRVIFFSVLLPLATLNISPFAMTGTSANQTFSSLTCTLRNVSVLPNREFRLDFVLQNRGSCPIYLYERWNSWGAKQWRIRVSDTAGNVRIFTNPQFAWEINYPSTFELAPNKEYVSHCALINREYRAWGTGEVDDLKIFVGTRGSNIGGNKVDWRSPVTLVGIFESLPSESSFRNAQLVLRYTRGVIFPSWGGLIETEPVTIDLPGESDNRVHKDALSSMDRQ